METYLGIDVGSVTTKLALLDRDNQLITALYLRTQGRPVAVIQEGLEQIRDQMPRGADICGVATTQCPLFGWYGGWCRPDEERDYQPVDMGASREYMVDYD